MDFAKRISQRLTLQSSGPDSSGTFNFLGLLSPVYLKWLGQSHNFVAFDPRGVNNSGISLSCFDEKANKNLFDTLIDRATYLESDDSYANRFAKDQAYGKWCHDGFKNSSAKYANTIALARDMLNYVETTAKQAGKTPEAANVNFFGISYGSVAGMTFATLFPDRVGRFVIDAIVYLEDYYAGTWYTGLGDFDDIMRYYFKSCFEAGPQACAFYANSTQNIELRYSALANNLKRDPIPVANRTLMPFPLTVSLGDFVGHSIQVATSPSQMFANYSKILKALEERDGTLLALGIDLQTASANYPPNHYFDYNIHETTQLIRCIDSANRYKIDTMRKFRNHVQYLESTSSYMGARGPTAAIICTAMNTVPPLSQQFPAKLPKQIKTKNPILFTSGRLDPVTPLASAQKMSEIFTGSKLLVQESVGHGTISWPTNCTAGHVQAYLRHGVLPPANTTCAAPGNPFLLLPLI